MHRIAVYPGPRGHLRLPLALFYSGPSFRASRKFLLPTPQPRYARTHYRDSEWAFDRAPDRLVGQNSSAIVCGPGGS
jgi:hypothetical protein